MSPVSPYRPASVKSAAAVVSSAVAIRMRG